MRDVIDRFKLRGDLVGVTVPPLDSGEFLAEVLRGTWDTILALVEDSAHGTKCLRTDLWKHLRVFLPPVPEQALICNWITATSSRFDAAITKIREQITRLREYRTALISAAVMGQIDVREAVDKHSQICEQ